jgi:hypothetical protein
MWCYGFRHLLVCWGEAVKYLFGQQQRVVGCIFQVFMLWLKMMYGTYVRVWQTAVVILIWWGVCVPDDICFGLRNLQYAVFGSWYKDLGADIRLLSSTETVSSYPPLFLISGADECALETIPTTSSSTMFIMDIPHDGILHFFSAEHQPPVSCLFHDGTSQVVSF